MSERELIAMMAALVQAGVEAAARDMQPQHAVDTALSLLGAVDHRLQPPPETDEQRRARNDATAKRVVAQLNAQQPNAP